MIFLNYVVQEMKLQTHSVFQAGTAVWYFFLVFTVYVCWKQCFVLLYCCIVVLLYCCIVVLLYCCIVVLLYCCIVVLPLEPRVLSCFVLLYYR